MKPAQLSLEQTIPRVSQMRKLGLSLREAHDRQYGLAGWFQRVEELRALPNQTDASLADINALRAVFREFWRQGDFAAIVEVSAKLPEKLLAHDDLLAAYTASAREQIANTESLRNVERKPALSLEQGYRQMSEDEAREKEALEWAAATTGE